MLARLSRGTARTLGLTLPRNGSQRQLGESSQSTLDDDYDDVVIDLDILIHPLHQFLTPWVQFAGACGRTLAPVYQNLHHIFIDDVDRVAQLLLDLEPVSEYDYMYDELAYDDDDHDSVELNYALAHDSSSSPDLMSLNGLHTVSNVPASHTKDYDPDSIPRLSCSSVVSKASRFALSERELPPRKQRKGTYLTQPIIIASSQPSIPTIIITPPEAEPPATSDTASAYGSCRIPIQDSAFRSRLTVPRHPTFNLVFPPMTMSLSRVRLTGTSSSSRHDVSNIPLPPPASFAPLVESWRWKNGHWMAVLPGLEEQARRGVFSRLVPVHSHLRAHSHSGCSGARKTKETEAQRHVERRMSKGMDTRKRRPASVNPGLAVPVPMSVLRS